MADDTSNKPYPFQFDPSQWTNPYSNFYGKALPFPPSYAGTPNNAAIAITRIRFISTLCFLS